MLRIEPQSGMTLMAEMKMPGEAILDLQIHRIRKNRVELRLISRFLPRGLAGLFYWYILYPWHVMIFKGMLKAIGRKAGGAAAGAPRKWRPLPQDQCHLFKGPP